MKKLEPLIDIENLYKIWKARTVKIDLIEFPDKWRQTQIWIAWKELQEGNIISIISTICEWLWFMLSQLRKWVEGGLFPMTKEEFIEEVNNCKKHIDWAIIDYNETEFKTY